MALYVRRSVQDAAVVSAPSMMPARAEPTRARGMRFAEVTVTLPVAGRFHYTVPEQLAERELVGARVLVRFSARKVTGVVVRTDTEAPPKITPVTLSEVL